MKIAIVHDYLVTNGGAERCLKALLDVFPEADIYALFYHKKRFKYLWKCKVKTSFLQNMPFIKQRHDIFLPLYSYAVRSFDLSRYDIVISSSWAWSKNIRKQPGLCHICYCYTPMRFAYVTYEERLQSIPVILRWLARVNINSIKQWDLKNTESVDYFISTCKNVKKRIKNIYKRDSFIIYPPINTHIFTPTHKEDKGYFFVPSRLVPYKKVDLVVKAFNSLKLPLKITGHGVEYNRLKSMAKSNIEFLGHVSLQDLVSLYQNCRAVIFPQEEDWGMAALETQSCGRPVIAYAAGGALESIVDGQTGYFFNEQTSEAIVEAVINFKNYEFDQACIRDNALQYDRDIFKQRIKSFVQDKYKDHAQGSV